MSITHQKAQEIFENHPTRFTGKEKSALRATLRAELNKMGYSDDEITEIKASGTNLLAGDPHAEYMFTAHYDTPGRTGWMLKTASLWGQTGANVFLIMIMCLLGMAVPIASSFIVPDVSGSGMFWLGELAVLLILVIMIISMVIKNKNNRNDNTSGVLALLAMAEKVTADQEMRKKSCFVFFDNEEWGLLGSGEFRDGQLYQKIPPGAALPAADSYIEGHSLRCGADQPTDRRRLYICQGRKDIVTHERFIRRC